jgi:hypothetical protein
MLIGFVTFAAGTALLVMAKELNTFTVQKLEFAEEIVRAS